MIMEMALSNKNKKKRRKITFINKIQIHLSALYIEPLWKIWRLGILKITLQKSCSLFNEIYCPTVRDICPNSVEVKIIFLLLFHTLGSRLKLWRIWYWKKIAVDKLDVAQVMWLIFNGVENIAVKGDYQCFSFSNYFQIYSPGSCIMGFCSKKMKCIFQNYQASGPMFFIFISYQLTTYLGYLNRKDLQTTM